MKGYEAGKRALKRTIYGLLTGIVASILFFIVTERPFNWTDFAKIPWAVYSLVVVFSIIILFAIFYIFEKLLPEK